MPIIRAMRRDSGAFATSEKGRHTHRIQPVLRDKYSTAQSLLQGKSVEEVMDGARHVLSSKDVMEGVVQLMPLIQVEAVFSDGSRLVSLHNPIT